MRSDFDHLDSPPEDQPAHVSIGDSVAPGAAAAGPRHPSGGGRRQQSFMEGDGSSLHHPLSVGRSIRQFEIQKDIENPDFDIYEAPDDDYPASFSTLNRCGLSQMYHHRSLEEAYVKFMFPSAWFVTSASAVGAAGSFLITAFSPVELPLVVAFQLALGVIATLLGCANFFFFTTRSRLRDGGEHAGDRNQSVSGEIRSATLATNPHAKAGERLAFVLGIASTVLVGGATYSRQQNCFLHSISSGTPQFNSCFSLLPVIFIPSVVFLLGVIPLRLFYAVPLLLCGPLATFIGHFWYPDRAINVGPKAMLVCFSVFLTSFHVVRRELEFRNRFELWVTLCWQRSRTMRRIARVRSILEMVAGSSTLHDIVEISRKDIQHRAQLKEEVAVVVARIDNFPSWNQRFTPIMAVELLDVYYTKCDAMAEKWKMDVVRRFGDVLIATSGFTSRSSNLSLTECLTCTLHFLHELFTFSSTSRRTTNLYNDAGRQRAMPLRIGVGFGEATYSIFSATKLAIVAVGPAVDDAETCAKYSDAARAACVSSSFAECFANSASLFYNPLYRRSEAGSEIRVFHFSGIEDDCAVVVEECSDNKQQQQTAPRTTDSQPSPPVTGFASPQSPNDIGMIYNHISVLGSNANLSIRFNSEELELRFADDSATLASRFRHVSQVLIPIASFTILTMYLLSEPEKYSITTIVLLLGTPTTTRVASRIADVFGFNQSRKVLPISVLQAIGLIVGVLLSKCDILTRSLSYLSVLLMLCVAFADVTEPWWVVAVLEIVISTALAVVELVRSPTAISNVIPVPFVCLLFIAVARSNELCRRQSFLYVQLSNAMVSETNEALKVHQCLLDRLLPNFVIETVARRSVERYQSCITSHIPDAVLMLIKVGRYHSGLSRSEEPAKPTLAQMFTVEQSLSCILSTTDLCSVEVVWFDGDSVLVGGPLQKPEVEESEQLVASRAGASMVPGRMKFRFICENLADEASLILLKILRGLSRVLASTGLQLTTVLHRGDGVAHVIGQSTPRFDVGGAIGTQLFAMHQAAAPGSTVLSSRFHIGVVCASDRVFSGRCRSSLAGFSVSSQHQHDHASSKAMIEFYASLGFTIAADAAGNVLLSPWRITAVGSCIVYMLTHNNSGGTPEQSPLVESAKKQKET